MRKNTFRKITNIEQIVIPTKKRKYGYCINCDLKYYGKIMDGNRNVLREIYCTKC